MVRVQGTSPPSEVVETIFHFPTKGRLSCAGEVPTQRRIVARIVPTANSLTKIERGSIQFNLALFSASELTPWSNLLCIPCDTSVAPKNVLVLRHIHARTAESYSFHL